MRLYVPYSRCPAASIETTVSRGIDTTWICFVDGVTRHSCTTSLRCPVTSRTIRTLACDADSPTRVSEPMTRMVKGPPPAATSSAMCTLLIWS